MLFMWIQDSRAASSKVNRFVARKSVLALYDE